MHIVPSSTSNCAAGYTTSGVRTTRTDRNRDAAAVEWKKRGTPGFWCFYLAKRQTTEPAHFQQTVASTYGEVREPGPCRHRGRSNVVRFTADGRTLTRRMVVEERERERDQSRIRAAAHTDAGQVSRMACVTFQGLHRPHRKARGCICVRGYVDAGCLQLLGTERSVNGSGYQRLYRSCPDGAAVGRSVGRREEL